MIEVERGLSKKSIFRNGVMLVYVCTFPHFRCSTNLHPSIKHFTRPVSTSFCQTYPNPFFSKIMYFKSPSSRSDSTGAHGCASRGRRHRIRCARVQRDVEREALKEDVTLEAAEGREKRDGDKRWSPRCEASLRRRRNLEAELA